MAKKIILIKGIVVALFILSTLSSFGQGVELRYGFTDGAVHKTMPNGDFNYVAGSFVRAFNRNEVLGNGLLIDTTGLMQPRLPFIDGKVRTAIPDENGGWYIGGDFGRVGGNSHAQIVHLLPDNSIDESFDVSFSGGVYSLLLDGDSLFVGGQFSVYNGVPAKRIVKIHKTTGQAGGWNAGVDNGNVSEMILDGDSLFVAGYFVSVMDGVERSYIAKFHKVNGGLSDFNPTFNQQVSAMAIDGDSLFLGGVFSLANGVSRSRLAKIHKATGEISPTWNPNANRNITQVTIHNDTLVVAGYFDRIDDQFIDMVAKVDMTTGKVDQTFDINGGVIKGDIRRVNSFAIDENDNFYITGYFQKIGASFKAYLAKVNPNGQIIDSFDVGLSERGNVISLQGDQLFVGGDFYAAGGEERIGLARFSKTDGNLDAWGPKTDRSVSSIHFNGDSLFVGGHFTQINNETRFGLAKLSTSTGKLSGWDPEVPGVEDFIFEGDSIYLAGSFSTVGSESRNKLAKIHKMSGIPGNWNPNASSTCYKLKLIGDSVLLGGVFTTINGEIRNRLAKVHKSSGELSNWNPDINSSVFALEVDGDSLFVGGFFSVVNGETRQRLAKISLSTGELSPSWIANTNQGVYDMLLEGSDLYVGGRFNRINNVFKDELIILDKTTAELNESFFPNMGGLIRTLHKEGDLMYVGGDFRSISIEDKVSSAVLRIENDINIDFSGTSFASGDTLIFEDQEILTASAPIQLTIENPAVSTDLVLTGTPLVEVFGDDAADFTINDAALESTILNGESSMFTVTFSPATGGSKSATIRIENGTSDIENPYLIQLRGYAIKNDQTITFESLDAKTYGDVDFELMAVASSGLAPTYTSSDESVATISGSTVTLLSGGTTQITAYQDGNSDYNAATPVMQELVVSKADQVITFGELDDQPFDIGSITLEGSASSGLDIVYVSSNENVVTISGNIATFIGAGTSTITATQSGDERFNEAIEVGQDLTITKGDQSISFESLSNATFGDDPITLLAEATSGLPITYESSDEAIAIVAGETLTIVGAGSVTITATQSGNDNFNAAAEVDRSLTVEKSDQIITFGSLQERSLAEGSFQLEANSSSGLEISYSSSNTAIATVTGNTVSLIGFGTTTITASQPGNENFNAASEEQQILKVKDGQAISFSSLTNKVYGDANFDLSATSSSGLDVSFVSSDPTIASISGNTVALLGAGTVTISAMQSGNGDYVAAEPVNQSLVIEKADQIISFSSLEAASLEDESITLSAVSDSGLPVTYISSDETVATISGNILTIEGAGTTTITATQIGNENYKAALPISHELEVEKLSQTITFEPLENRTYGDESFEFQGSSTSGLDLIYTSSNTDVAMVSGALVTIVGAGSTIITANQVGNENYKAASPIEQELIVNKVDQTITFDALDNKSYGDENFQLSGVSSSNLDVAYSSSNPSVATISGNMVTIVGAGSTVITANQNGSNNYLEANPVDQELIVNKASQTITMESLPGEAITTDQTILISASATSGLDVSFEINGPASLYGNKLVFQGSGSVEVKAIQVGDANYEEATSETQIIVVNKADQSITFEELQDVNIEVGSVTLQASASSGLDLEYAVTGPAILNGNQLLLNGEGMIEVTANQSGNAIYHPAQAVIRSFEVTKVLGLNNQVTLKVVPNPIVQNVYIEAPMDITLEVVDLNGKVLMELESNKSVDFSDIKPGQYLIKGVYKGDTVSKRIIKR